MHLEPEKVKSIQQNNEYIIIYFKGGVRKIVPLISDSPHF